MTRRQGAVGAGVVLGLLLLWRAGCGRKPTPVEAVQALGGRVRVDASRPDKPVVGVDLSGTKVTDAGLKELKELKRLDQLYLYGTQVTDAGVEKLKAARPELQIER